MVLEPPGTLERVNAALPERFEVFGIDRVTNGFNAKTMCDRRRYEYVIPTWAFDPNVGRETGRAARTPRRRRFELTESTRARVNAALKNYCGTHNFHNYTVKVKPTDAQAKRYILSFVVQPLEANARLLDVKSSGSRSCCIRFVTIVPRSPSCEANSRRMIRSLRPLAPTRRRRWRPSSIVSARVHLRAPHNHRLDRCTTRFNWTSTRKRAKFQAPHVYTHIANQEREQNTLRHWIRDTLHANNSAMLDARRRR